MNEVNTEICLVGAGPIGIEMAVALSRAGIEYLHLEAGCLASTMCWWAPETLFFSSSDRIAIAGVPLQNSSQQKTTREQYLSYLRSVAAQFDLQIEFNSRVTQIQADAQGWQLEVSSSSHGVGGPEEQQETWKRGSEPLFRVHAKKVIFAIGDMHLPHLLEIPGESLPHVSHYLQEPHTYYGKEVLIVGGKNSAVEAAIRLQRVGAEVTLSYRGSTFEEGRVKTWLLPEIASLIKRELITFLPRTTIEEITAEEVLLRSAENPHSPKARRAQAVVLLTGYRQDSSLFSQAGMTLTGDSQQPIYNQATMETDAPGIYVAGTAAAGTQLGGVTEFIETSHVHTERILAHLTGKQPPTEQRPRSLQERET